MGSLMPLKKPMHAQSIRAVYSDASVTTTLITAKTKVASLKSVTIPKLELCAAHLLAHMFVSYLGLCICIVRFGQDCNEAQAQ